MGGEHPFEQMPINRSQGPLLAHLLQRLEDGVGISSFELVQRQSDGLNSPVTCFEKDI